MGTEGIEGLQESMMTSSWGIMKFEEESLSKCWVVRNTYPVAEIPNTIELLQVRWSTIVAFGIEGIFGISCFDIVQKWVRKSDMGWEQLAELLEKNIGCGAVNREEVQAGEGISSVFLTFAVHDAHVGLVGSQVLSPSCLAAGEVSLCEEVPQAVMVGVQGKVFATFQVMPEDFDSMYNC
jgi:hypothetical protein